MTEAFDSTKEALEAAKKISPKGGEYWMGRDIQEILGYARWENFDAAIKRAMDACRLSGVEVGDHFRDTTKRVAAGSGALMDRADYFVDRYACYLIAMNGDPSKPEVASAQTYFAVKARLQEIDEQQVRLQKRSEQRERISAAVNLLNKTASRAGVQNYALFHDAGYRGLYQMGLKELRQRKGLSDKEDLYDRAGPTELAANEFRLTQARDKIERDNIKGQQHCEIAHKEVGEEVRRTIATIGGTMPERLSAEPSLKKQISEGKKKAKALAKAAAPKLPKPKAAS